MAEEVDENTSAYLQKFEKFEDVLSVLLQKIWFIGESLPLFLNLPLQQLH